MDINKKKEELEKFKQDVDGLEEGRKKLRDEIVDFELSEEYETYKQYLDAGDETQIKKQYPIQYAIYRQIAEFDEKIDTMCENQENIIIELHKEINNSIEELDKKIKTNSKYLNQLEEDIQNIVNEIVKIQETEEFKKGNEETIKKVEQLEEKVELKIKLKEKIGTMIEEISVELNKVKEFKQQLIDDFGEGLAKEAEHSKNAESSKTEQEEKDSEKINKNKKISNNGNAVEQPLSKAAEEKSEEDQKKEAEEKIKSEFKELYEKAQKGTLTSKDFDALAEIMKNPDNYDKLEITTGVVFNKAKVIFKAMAKTANVKGIRVKKINEQLDLKLGEAEELLKQDRESLSDEDKKKWDLADTQKKQYDSLRSVFAAYQEVCNTRNQQKKSWFAKSKNTEQTALPSSEKNESEAIGTKLAGLVEPPEAAMNTVNTHSKAVEEPAVEAPGGKTI